jgi:hypothetical protein
MKSRRPFPVVVLLLLAGVLACSIPFLPVAQAPTSTPPPSETPAELPVTAATQPPPSPTSPPPSPSPTPIPPSPTPNRRIGLVTRELDVVQRGSDSSSLQKIEGSSDLFTGDFLNIQEGGEGLLDFGSGMRLRMFNDSTLGVTAASAPGTPLDVRLFLEDGGFTGELTEPGGQVTFTTPNQAVITVLGTRFLVAYDPRIDVTTVANFEGAVGVASPAGELFLPDGHYTLVYPGDPPDPPLPFRIEMAEYERLARFIRSPLLALQEVGMVDRPPFIRLIHVSTDFIDIGNECPGQAKSATIWVEIRDDRGPEGLETSAVWTLGEQRGSIELKSEETDVYTGEVGGFNQPGDLIIQVSARDGRGQLRELEPIEIQVGFCIG